MHDPTLSPNRRARALALASPVSLGSTLIHRLPVPLVQYRYAQSASPAARLCSLSPSLRQSAPGLVAPSTSPAVSCVVQVPVVLSELGKSR
jgi:hypothetical protein